MKVLCHIFFIFWSGTQLLLSALLKKCILLYNNVYNTLNTIFTVFLNTLLSIFFITLNMNYLINIHLQTTLVIGNYLSTLFFYEISIFIPSIWICLNFSCDSFISFHIMFFSFICATANETFSFLFYLNNVLLGSYNTFSSSIHVVCCGMELGWKERCFPNLWNLNNTSVGSTQSVWTVKEGSLNSWFHRCYNNTLVQSNRFVRKLAMWLYK